MNFRLIVFWISVTATLNSPISARSETIVTTCISESGLSIYDLNLNLTDNSGQIRYRYMQQDVYYSVTLQKVESGVFSGVAVFESSNTGEIRGNDFSFSYDTERDVFEELNVKANCR